MEECTPPGWRAALRANSPYRDIARQYQLSKDALARHRGNHLTQNEDADTSLPAGVAEIVAQALAILNDAWPAETWSQAMLNVREARRSLERMLTKSAAYGLAPQ